MMLSITTDYVTDYGNPAPYLRRIADAGFSHLHWCHHWRSDFLYDDAEIKQIGCWLKEFGLQLNDVHGSEGTEKFWYSAHEYARLAGVELVKNRLHFAAELGADVIVMHVYPEPEEPLQNDIFWTQLYKTLDALEPYAKGRGVRIAIENLLDFSAVRDGRYALHEVRDNFDTIQKLLARYDGDYLGTCYDSGHAHLGYDRMEKLIPLKERLIALHLHDNDGTQDSHRLLFSDMVDWSKLAGIIARSSYQKCTSLEVSMSNMAIMEEETFLSKAFDGGSVFTKMVECGSYE